jgi:glycosyltransferase involved in cell wall biosynthesis
MKILLISNGFPPRQWAGTETYTAGLAIELGKRGHQVHVLCGGNWQEDADYWNEPTDEFYQGIPVRRINLNWTKAPDPFRYLFENSVVADYLRNYLKIIQPDLVHVTSCERLSASVLTVVKQAGLPLVLSLTDFWFLCPRITLLRGDSENCDGQTTTWDCLKCLAHGAKIYRWPRSVLPEPGVAALLTAVSRFPIFTRQSGLRGMVGDVAGRKRYLRTAFQLADYRTTASKFVHDLFVNNGFDAPIQIQPYGHNIDWLEQYRGKTASQYIRIGFIGQIVPPKGVHLILEALHRLEPHQREQFRIFIYGSLQKAVEYGNQLKQLAAKLQNVEFCGTYLHEQSGDVFANFDFLVVPSLWYDFPLVVHEAFASQTPVVATRLGGMAEAVRHDVNGLLFERGNVADLAKQFLRMIEEPGLLERLRTGIQPVKTVATEVTELEAVYGHLTTQQTHPHS